MGTRVKFAPWRRDGKLYRVRPPDWPKHCELSFTDKEDMMEWAAAAHVMLKDVNPQREVRHGSSYSANFR